MEKLIGKILGNRYEILEKIGEGGMSVVYKAKCHSLNRIVAIKVLKQEYSNDDEFLVKFKNEALSVAKLNNGNIINVFDVGQEENISYIVMEYVDGRNLKELLKIQKKFPVEKVLDISKQIAMALEEAHNKKIVHRDIKAQNIMLTTKGVVKVGDFGIAKAVSSSTITASGAIMGSVHYFSPEQARGGFVDERSDLYSLGIIMYEMVTGRLPFDGDSPVNIALKHIQNDISFLESDDVPLELQDMIMKLTQKNPDKRYSSATSLIRDISYLQDGKKVHRYSYDEENDYSTKKVPIIKRDDFYKNERLNIEEDSEIELEKKGNKKPSIVTILAIITAIGLLGIVFSMRGFLFQSSKNAIPVPHIIGMSEQEARETLEGVGLQLNVVKTEPNTKYDSGQVTDTNPNEGIKVPKGTIVNVILADSSKEKITLENFVGQDFSEVEKKYLGKLQFKTEFIPSTEPTNRILEQQPSEGTEVELGSQVILFLSKNANDIPISVPSVIGKDASEAKGMLSSFKVSESYKEDKDQPEGVVLSQKPEEGEQAKPKSTVHIVVNKYERPKTVTKQIVVTLPRDSEVVSVKITDQSSSKVIFNRNVTVSDVDGILSLDVEGLQGETRRFEIEVDSSFYDTTEINF